MAQLSYIVNNTTTPGTRSTPNAITSKYVEVIGDTINTSYQVTHGFGTRDVVVSVYQNNPPYAEAGFTYDGTTCTVIRNSIETVQVDFNSPPGSASYRVVIISIA